MPDIIPTSTTVLVCSGVPLDNKYNDTILFTSPAKQQEYFRGKTKYSYNGNFTYQRVQNKVNNYSTLQTLPNPRIEFSCRIPVNADKVYDCNYLCFCNEYDTSKWWYCFIKEINYINPNCCEIIYEIDAIQTFLFDFKVQKSFVEREHTATDDYFEHVCLEDEICVGDETLLNIENISEGRSTDTSGEVNFHCLCADSETIRTASENHGGIIFEGAEMGRKINGLLSVGFGNRNDCMGFLKEITEGDGTVEGGKANECVAIISVPALMANGQWEVEARHSFLKPEELDGYYFHNKMLCSYPFRKFIVVSSSGDSYTFRPQLFIDETNKPKFLLNRVFTGDDLIFSLKPNYQMYENKSKQLYLKTAQLGSWSTSAYQNWLAQNRGSLTAQTVGGVVNTIAGIAMIGLSAYSGNAVGVIMGAQNAGQGIRDLTQAEGRKADAKHLPDDVHGTYNNSDMEFELNEMGFWLYDFVLNEISLKRIDDYFTRYGYKVNKIKVPSPFDGHQRPKFNYVKTVDVNITGSVPTPQMNIIKSAFNSGITFWHNKNVGEYEEGENDV